MAKDHYALLEVTMAADGNAIATSYRRLARMKHPDKNRDNPDATAEFQALQEAYSVLKDEQKRKEYDRKLMYKSGGRPGAGMPFSGMHNTRATSSSNREFAAFAAAAVNAHAAEMAKKRARQRGAAQHFDKNEGGEGLNSYHTNESGGPAGRPMMNPRGPPKGRNSSMPWAYNDPGTTQAEAGYAAGGFGGGGGFKSGFNTGGFSAGRMGASAYYGNSSYPPVSPDEPKWPKQPPPKDHALEKQIREARKDVRAEEKAIRKLGRTSKKAAAGIGALWQNVHNIEDQIAHAHRKQAQLEQSSVTHQWYNGLFGVDDGIGAMPAPPVAQPSMESQAKINERLKKTQLSIDSLQKKLVKAHAEIDGAMGQSRSIAATIQDAEKRKATKQAKLDELCRRWRIHEFGASSVGAGDDTWTGWAGSWDEVEEEADSDDDEDDDEEDEAVEEEAKTEPGNSWWGKDSDKKVGEDGDKASDAAPHSHHDYSSFSYNPAAKEWVPDASVPGTGAKTESCSSSSSSSESSVDGEEETQDDDPKAGDIPAPTKAAPSSPGKKDLEGLVFDTGTTKVTEEVKVQGDATESVKDGAEAKEEEVKEEIEPAKTEGVADTTQPTKNSHTADTSDSEQPTILARNYGTSGTGYTRSFAYYHTSQQQQHPVLSHDQAFPNYGQYEYFKQYGQYSPGYGGQHEQMDAEDYTAYTAPEDDTVIDDTVYYEEHDGGVAIGGDYQQGKGKPRPDSAVIENTGQQGQQDRSSQARHVGQGLTCIRGVQEGDSHFVSDYVSASSTITGRRADQPQNTITTRPPTFAHEDAKNTFDENGIEGDVIDLGEGDVDGHDNDNDNDHSEETRMSAWFDEKDNVNDLLGPLEAARLGVDQHMPIYNVPTSSILPGATTAMAQDQGLLERPGRVSRARVPGRSAVSAAISSLTGEAGAGNSSQSWWSGAEQLGTEQTPSATNDYDNREQAWRQAMWQGW